MKRTKEFLNRRIVALFMAILMVVSVIVPSQPASAEGTTEPGTGTEGTETPGTEVATSNVTIKVVDSVDATIDLTSGVTLVVKSGETEIAPTEGVYVLNQGAEYTYSLSGKTGYTDATGTFTVEAAETFAVTLNMTMDDIQVSATATDLKVGKTTTASVDNAIAGAPYTWATSDANVASVDPATGAVTAVAAGTAKITASYNGKTSNEITVNVTKNDTAIKLAVDPTKGGTDQSKVVVDVTDIPSDATGTVQFFVNSTMKNEVTLSGQTELEWTYEDSDLRGDYTFYAVYSGDGKYNGSTSATVDATGFTKSQKIVFRKINESENSELNPKIVKIGDATFDVRNDLIDHSNSKYNTTLTYKSENTDVLTVDESGVVTIVGSGEACITITAIAKDNYLEATATYYVYVEEEYALADLEDEIQVATASKTYDGNADVKVTATLSNLDQLKIFTKDFDASKGLVLDVTATVSSKDATTYNEITVVSIDKITGKDSEGNDIDLTDRIFPRITDIANEKLAADYTINQRTVYLGTNAWTMTYGSKATEKIATETGLVKEIKVVAEPETGVVDGDTVAFADFKATVAEDIYDIRDHKETVQVDYASSKTVIEANPNYKFVDATDKANFGTLTVLQANLTLEEILANISVTTADGGIFYQNSEGELWINGGSLKATVGTDYQPYYDSVMFKLNSDTTDLTNTGYDVSDITTSKITGKLYLQKGMNTCAEVDFSFTVDTTAPDFTFGDWTERTTVLDTWVGMITFNKYVNNYYTIEGVDYDDDVIENALQESVTQSGVDSWQYHIYKVTDDEKLTQANLQEYVKTVTWTDGTTDNKIPVCTEANGSLKEVQGNYIVLVKITDMVGNGIVYSTNGLVIDVTAPTVEILAADDLKLDQTKYYQDSVAYKVKLTDSETSAGLASAVIQVFDGDKEIDKYEYSFADDTKSYTLSELNGLSTKTITQDEDGEDLVITTESNNLKIVVTAIDQAGNECDPVEQKLMIDATVPKIDVEFNNDADVKNDKYFNTDRVMTIKYIEKNFNKEDVTFDVGTETNLSLTELCTLYNIKTYKWTDSEEGKDVTTYTNDRVNTLELTFDQDGEYYIVPDYVDLSGKEDSLTYVDYTSSTEVPGYVKEFVIDKTVPVVSVEYFVLGENGSETAIDLSTNKDKRTYTDKTVKAVVTIKENNFWLTETVADGETETQVNKFSKDPLQMDFAKTTVENPASADEKLENYQELSEVAEDWSYVQGEAKRTFTFTANADYTFDFTYTDIAGSSDSITATHFTVDTIDPVVSVKFESVDANTNVVDMTSAVPTTKGDRLYSSKVVKATVTVKEHNFMADNFDFGMKFNATQGSNPNPKSASITDYANQGNDKNTWTYDDANDVATATFVFETDADYTFDFEYADLAGRTYEYAKEGLSNFTVDKIDPEIKVTYEVMDGKQAGALNPSSTEAGRSQVSAKVVKATVKITERNFYVKNENETLSFLAQWNYAGTKAIDSKNNDVLLDSKTADKYYEGLAYAASEWNYVDDVATKEFIFEVDANYTFKFAYSDLAGRTDSYESVYFTVDDTLPTGNIQISEVVKEEGTEQTSTVWKEIWDKLFAIISFDIFRNYSHNIKLEYDDATSDELKVEYLKARVPLEIEESWTDAEREEYMSQQAWETWEDVNSIPVADNEQYVIYARVTDEAGNVLYMYPTSGIVSDNTKPEMTVTVTNPTDAKNGIYNEDVKINIQVEDPTAGDTYSGLETVWYTVVATGNVTTQEDGDKYVIVDNSADKVQKVEYKEYNKDIVIPAKQYNSNDVKVQVHALDFSGNQYDSEVIKLKIDVTEPTIKVEYDLNEPLNGSYYKATRTATVTVTERNFDPSAIRWNITNTDSVQPVISGWTSSSDAGVKDAATHTCTVTFAADGDYTLTLNCTDLAGNDSNYTQVDSFTVDQTVPVIGVAFDNNNVKNATYFDAPRTATITVTEHNFNSNEVITAIIATLEAQGITVPPVSSWTTVGDVHTATIYFGEDGDYSFTVNYSDLAGNAATEVVVSEFTVDQTKPVVEIFDIVDRSANNGVVAPGVRYSDVNYDENNVSITIKGAQHSEKAVDGTRTQITNGQSIKMADFAYEEDVDDVYTLTVKATDQAGNFDEKSVIFSVNRFGSNFIFSVTTEAFLEKYYSNEEQDLVVTEINVDTLEHRGISYGRDGEHVDLEEGTDYSVKASGNEVTWKSYEYTINAANFEEEGLYNVTIDSLDRATNQVNNKIKDANIEFVIDKTKPTVVITGIEAGGQYRAAERDISIAVADNVAMTDVDVLVDDKSVEVFDATAIMEQGGELPVTLGSDTNWQYVTAVATDAAGNVAETSEYGVLITTNVLIQYYRNTPLFVGSLVGVAAVAGFFFFLIGKKKKKEEEQ